MFLLEVSPLSKLCTGRLGLGRLSRAVQFSILGGEFDDCGEVERGAVAGILDVVGA
jgi:hypothetical protein